MKQTTMDSTDCRKNRWCPPALHACIMHSQNKETGRKFHRSLITACMPSFCWTGMHDCFYFCNFLSFHWTEKNKKNSQNFSNCCSKVIFTILLWIWVFLVQQGLRLCLGHLDCRLIWPPYFCGDRFISIMQVVQGVQALQRVLNWGTVAMVCVCHSSYSFSLKFRKTRGPPFVNWTQPPPSKCSLFFFTPKYLPLPRILLLLCSSSAPAGNTVTRRAATKKRKHSCK